MEYYLILAGFIVIGIPVILGFLSYLWNRKWRVRQNARGVAVDKFGNIFKRGMRFTFKEDPGTLAPKKASPKVKKWLRVKNLYLVLILASLGFLAVQEFLIPFLLVTLMVFTIWIRANNVFKTRHRILSRMFEVANSVFRYGRGAELNPWRYVNIQQWDGLTVPGKTVVSFPASWKSDSTMARDGFESHFNSTVTDENSWVYEWKNAEGQVLCTPVSHLPTKAAYEGSEKYPWNVFPLGEGADGVVTYDIISYPHVLIAGTTGSGKSVLQRNLLFHCIQHNDQWRFIGVDVKQVELTPFLRYSKTVMGVGINVEEGLEIIKYAHDIMTGRYAAMKASGVNHFMKTEDADRPGKTPFALMVMVDEAFAFLSPKGGSSDAAKAENDMKGEASSLLSDLARLGRAAGVFLVIATQRPDATVITGELKNNLDVRIAAGRLDSTPSSMVLDSGAATQLPGHVKGRGIVRYAGQTTQFQGFFAEQDWIDQWLAKHPGVEPDLDAELNPGFKGEIEYDPSSDIMEKEFREETGILEDSPIDQVEAERHAAAIEHELDLLDETDPLDDSALDDEVVTDSHQGRIFQPELPIAEEEVIKAEVIAPPAPVKTFGDMPYSEFYDPEYVDLDAPIEANPAQQRSAPTRKPEPPLTPPAAFPAPRVASPPSGNGLPTRPPFPGQR